MVVAAIEKDNPKLCSKLVSLSFRSPGSPFWFLMSVVGAVTGISSFVAAVEGATMAIAFGVVKTIFDVYFSVFGAAWAVYEFGDCMGW